MQHLALLAFGPSDKELNNSGTEIEAIEQNVACDHNRCQAEPESCHGQILLYASTWLLSGVSESRCGIRASGPCATSRATRNKKRIPNTMYIPMKPRKVNSPLPAEPFLNT